MDGVGKTRVVGAFVVGAAIVAGTYVVTNFGAPYRSPAAQPATGSEVAATRVAIPVADSDDDGLEDWKEGLIKTDPIRVDEAATVDYTPPETLTGQFGVAFFQDIVRANGYQGFGATNEELVARSTDQLLARAADTLYTEADLVTVADGETNIRTYANRAATILTEHEIESTENELLTLKRAFDTGEPELLTAVAAKAAMYASLRDAYLNTPVPEYFVPAHLALINALNALHHDLSAMAASYDDPLYAMVRLKRYEDDATGLALALNQMYLALERTPVQFTEADAAVLFTNFRLQDV